MIDANARALVRSFLELDDVVERVRGEEDVQAALLELVAEPTELHPRAIHVKPVIVVEDTSWYDDPPKLDADGQPILNARTERVRRQSIEACPDCGRQLVSRATDLICPRLPSSTELTADHEWCAIACGLEG